MKPKIKLAIAEDSAYNQSLLKNSLQYTNHIALLFIASNGLDFLNKINPAQLPDVVLMDIKMPYMSGIETTAELLKRFPKTKVLAYTIYDNEDLIIHMLDAGAIGYIFKTVSSTKLFETIESVYNNTFNPRDDIYAGILFEFEQKKQKDELKLSKNELHILNYICSGLINKEIAKIMNFKAGTVNGYRKSLLEKTGSRNTADLVCFAINKGYFHSSQNKGSRAFAAVQFKTMER